MSSRRPERRRRAFSCALALALAVPGAVCAQDVAPGEALPGPEASALVVEPPAHGPPRIAVLMLPTGEVDPAITDALTELLISAVAARHDDVRIVGKEELQAQLGQADATSVECVESAACLGRVGVQLDVAEVIAGTIARRDGPGGELVWAFNLNRLDVRTGELLGRVFREVTGELGVVLDALEESFPELYARRIQPGRLVIRATVEGAIVEIDGAVIGRYAGEPLRRESVEPGPHVIRVHAPGHRQFEREIDVEEASTIFIEAALERGGSWVGSPLLYVGAAVMVASLGGAIGLGISSQAEPDATLTMRETIEVFYPARETEAVISNVLVGVSAAGLVAGAIGFLMSGEELPDDDGPSATVYVAPAVGGALVGAEGRF